MALKTALWSIIKSFKRLCAAALYMAYSNCCFYQIASYKNKVVCIKIYINTGYTHCKKTTIVQYSRGVFTERF